MKRQLAELEQKARDMKPLLVKMIERGQKVFQKYAEVEQDPSWFQSASSWLKVNNACCTKLE